MPKVLVTRSLPPRAMTLLESSGHDLIVWPEDCSASRSFALENVKGCQGALVMLTDKVDQEFLDAAGPSLKVVSTMSVGYDHLSLPPIKAASLRVGYTPGVLTDAVADLTVALALMAGRRIGEAIAVVKEGKWPAWGPMVLAGPQIKNSTVGFVGYGRISSAVLDRLIPFKPAKIIYTSSSGRASTHPSIAMKLVDVDTLASEADIVFILTSYSPATHHMISTSFFNKMKPTAILINTARGPIVDTAALVSAIHDKKIFGAGIDVVEGEPNIPADHPLLREPRCAVLPHIGSATTECREEMGIIAVKNLLAGLDGSEMVSELTL